ncbi:hypothetical protein R2601_02798 [Salipiger bermudensis HTCC2601]|uniref:Uncharacterized protein n=1 Tax=Salipiger bermudensis (strain DSM 26914 / JCM 13377 / KCTC 12554 / HTCC2601) TaxID=314265 RepID=Q0FWT6_SALBH|nr:hypothetical protein R2601_02798 [Salipiger bermudensis HTCC2601]
MPVSCSSAVRAAMARHFAASLAKIRSRAKRRRSPL